MSTMDSAMLADEALERLRKHHDGEIYGCAACYRLDPCPERELIRQYDRMLADYGKRLSVAEAFERDSTRLRAAIHEHERAVVFAEDEGVKHNADEALWAATKTYA